MSSFMSDFIPLNVFKTYSWCNMYQYLTYFYDCKYSTVCIYHILFIYSSADDFFIIVSTFWLL